MTDRLFNYGAPLGGYIDPVTGKLMLDIGGRQQPAPTAPTAPPGASTRVNDASPTVDVNLITAPGMGQGQYPEPLAKLRQWFDPETYGPTGGATWEQPSALLPMAMHPGPGGRPEEKFAIPRAIKEGAQFGLDLLASPWTGGVPESTVGNAVTNALFRYGAGGVQAPNTLEVVLGKAAKQWPAEAAAKAELMAKEGLDTPQIYRATGVDPRGIKSTAGNPFFEISDANAVYRVDRGKQNIIRQEEAATGAKMKPEQYFARLKELNANGYETTLGVAYEHPELYANHPEFANMPLKVEPAGGGGILPEGVSGAYVNGTMHLSAEAAADPFRATTVIQHELGHGVQSANKWPSGSNSEFAKKQFDRGEVADRSLQLRLKLQEATAGTGETPQQYLEKIGIDTVRRSLVLEQALDPKISTAELKRHAAIYKKGKKYPAEDRPHEMYKAAAGEYQSRMDQERAGLTEDQLRDLHITEHARMIGETPEAAQIVFDRQGRPLLEAATRRARRPGMKPGINITNTMPEPEPGQNPYFDNPNAPAGPVFKQPPATNSFFDLKNLEQVPDVPQTPMERYIPKKGMSERLQAVLADKGVQRRVKDIIEKGVEMGGKRWYNTEPLRQAFINELGDTEGQIAYTRYMDYVAATSPRSKVGENIRNASYYYARERQGLPQPTPKPSEEFPKNPKPYGHMAQRLHRGNAQIIQGGGFDIFKNPKPPTFSLNLQGNQFPATIDAHATKLPAMLSRDPRWLATNIRQQVAGTGGNTGVKKQFVNVKPRDMFVAGDIDIKDAIKEPTFWTGRPNPNEYAGLEKMYQDIAKKVGITPAQAQASAWIAGGKITGLGSDSSKAFMDFFEERLMHTAQMYQESPSTTLRKFIRGERPLLGIGLSVGELGDVFKSMQQDERQKQQQPPPTGDRLLQAMGSQS